MSSQQMHEDNKSPQYTEGYNAEARFERANQFDYRTEQATQFSDRPAQKVYPQDNQAYRVTSKQRMIVAIVSVSILVPLTAVILTTNVSDETAGNIFIIGSRLVALILVCLTIMIVNLALGWRRS